MEKVYRGPDGIDPLLDLLASERLIAYRPSFARLTGSVTAAVLLSQFLYWTYTDTVRERDGWFWKTMPEIEEETGLTRREQDSARKSLRGLGVLLEDKRGIPMKIWFKVDREQLFSLLRDVAAANLGGKRQDWLAEVAEIGRRKQPSKVGVNSQATSETTTDITLKEKTLNVPEGGVYTLTLEPVIRVVELTGDTKSFRRFVQLWEITSNAGWKSLWDEAERSLKSRMQNASRGTLERPGAYFSATLIALLEKRGVTVPSGTPEERATVASEIRESLNI